MSKGDLKIQRNSLSKLKNVSLIKGINDVYSGCTCSLIMEYNYILSSVLKPCLHPDTVWLRLCRTYNIQNEWPSLQSPVLSVSAEVRRMFVEEPPSWQGYHCYWQTIDRHVGIDSHRLLSRLLLPSFLLRMRMYKPSVPRDQWGPIVRNSGGSSVAEFGQTQKLFAPSPPPPAHRRHYQTLTFHRFAEQLCVRCNNHFPRYFIIVIWTHAMSPSLAGWRKGGRSEQGRRVNAGK